MIRISHRTFVKSGKSRLQIMLRHGDLRHDHHHTPPSSSMPIHFLSETRHRFMDKENENFPLGERKETTGEKEIYVDHRFFFQYQHEHNSSKDDLGRSR